MSRRCWRLVAVCLQLTVALAAWAGGTPSAIATAVGLPSLRADPSEIDVEVDNPDQPPISLTVYGAGCTSQPGVPTSVIVTVDNIGNRNLFTASPDAAGDWRVSFDVDPHGIRGFPVVHATCDNYLGAREYDALEIPVVDEVPCTGPCAPRPPSPCICVSHARTTARIVGGDTVVAGGSVEVVGRYWANFDKIDIALHSAAAVELTTLSTGEFGSFDVDVTIPADTALGRHEIVVAGGRARIVLPITVVAGRGLSVSGFRLAGLLSTAIALVLSGWALLGAARRGAH